MKLRGVASPERRCRRRIPRGHPRRRAPNSSGSISYLPQRPDIAFRCEYRRVFALSSRRASAVQDAALLLTVSNAGCGAVRRSTKPSHETSMQGRSGPISSGPVSFHLPAPAKIRGASFPPSARRHFLRRFEKSAVAAMLRFDVGHIVDYQSMPRASRAACE